MRHLVRRLTVLCALIACQCGASCAPRTFDVTILHTNDIHGHLLPFAYTEAGRGPAERPSVGGAARRYVLVQRLRKTIPHPVVLVDAGDIFNRGPLANAYEGQAEVATMNAMGYALAAVGNNEFKAKGGVDENDAAGSQRALLRIAARSRFPWLCANLTRADGAPLPGIRPYVVKVIGGVRVGFLGLTAPRSADYPQTRGWRIADPVAAARRYVPVLRRQCDVLIAVTHIGFDADRELVASTTGIDAVVGGDSHTFLYRPAAVANNEGSDVPIVQDGEFGVNLGRFDLRFTRDAAGRYRLTAYNAALLPVDQALEAKAPASGSAVSHALRPYLAPFRRTVGFLRPADIGKTPGERTGHTAQVIAAAMRSQTGADIGLRPNDDGLFEVFRRPAVTRYDVYAILPFRNHVVTARLTGSEIEALLAANPKTAVAGAPPGFVADRVYTVAMEDFLATSRFKLAAERLKDRGLDLRDAVIRYLGTRARPERSKPTAGGLTAGRGHGCAGDRHLAGVASAAALPARQEPRSSTPTCS